MNCKTVVLASFLALSVVACGDADDAAKPDDNKNKIPEKNQACIDAGDKCQLKDGQWVISKKDEPKPGNDDKEEDEVPVADGTFDYSEIGVTDKLDPEKRGFGFYHKGAKSPLDSTWFKNGLTQSPTIPWSSTKEYDVDLYNFVAIRLNDATQKDQKKVAKFMFDKIGEVNQAVNPNANFFGEGKNSAELEVVNPGSPPTTPPTYKFIYAWNKIPALVNTFMMKTIEGGRTTWVRSYADTPREVFYNQEEDTRDNDGANVVTGTGAKKSRVYGVNAFLVYPTGTTVAKDDAAKLIGLSGKPYEDALDSTDPDQKKYFYKLSSRSDKTAVKHVNFATYLPYKMNKKKFKAKINCDNNPCTITTINDQLVAGGPKAVNMFPTQHILGELKSVQFGRLTGEGIDPEADMIPGYKDELIKPYPFTEGNAAIGGNDSAEDWYFARGTVPTSVAALDRLKEAGKPLTYLGQAVMYGINYDPRRPIVSNEDVTNQSTNSVKPAGSKWSKEKTLLDGKQNFVSLTWNPENGEVNGSVYGVWTLATYLRSNQEWKGSSQSYTPGQVLQLKIGPNNRSFVPDDSKPGLALPNPEDSDQLTNFLSQAIQVKPYTINLVTLKGKVVEGTNQFGGLAVREKDKSKGLFTGAFFGPNGYEVGGVINSQTGDMKNRDLVDPTSKWGGAFGAARPYIPTQEDLLFANPEINYNTSTEFFN